MSRTATLRAMASTPVTAGDVTKSARLLLGLIGVIMLALLSWQVVALGYRLETGSFGGGSPDAQASQDVTGAFVRYDYTAERSYELYFAVRNPDRLPVRIDGIDEDRLPGLRLERLTMMREGPGCCAAERATPFRPVRLDAGEEIYLFATLRMDGSPASATACASQVWSSVPVRFSVLGTTRHQEVPLLATLVIRSAPGTACTV
ncbi:hypothetical protein GCM10009679_03960 [Saccharothrix algeriensis]|uniref:Uncharacterized protein n=2 Tax=Catellatospora bangladeshensis TaxID=310355 RepID=A0A8J3NF24_9ACTN|nr:hypothetical protein Cba03nite_03360 [Catellatospora bangladeshensis]